MGIVESANALIMANVLQRETIMIELTMIVRVLQFCHDLLDLCLDIKAGLAGALMFTGGLDVGLGV